MVGVLSGGVPGRAVGGVVEPRRSGSVIRRAGTPRARSRRRRRRAATAASIASSATPNSARRSKPDPVMACSLRPARRGDGTGDGRGPGGSRWRERSDPTSQRHRGRRDRRSTHDEIFTVLRPQPAQHGVHVLALQHLRRPLIGRDIQVEIPVRILDATRLAIEAAPVIDQLVPGDPDQPGHGHLVDPVSLDLADRSEKGLCREILGELAMTAASPVIAVHLIDGDVVDGEQIGGVFAATFRNRLGHHPHHRSAAPNSDTPARMSSPQLRGHDGAFHGGFRQRGTREFRTRRHRGDRRRPGRRGDGHPGSPAGARVMVFEKGAHGRDKVCGDGLTPRAVGAWTNWRRTRRRPPHRGPAHDRRQAGPRARLGRHAIVPGPRRVWPRRRLDAGLMEPPWRPGPRSL